MQLWSLLYALDIVGRKTIAEQNFPRENRRVVDSIAITISGVQRATSQKNR